MDWNLKVYATATNTWLSVQIFLSKITQGMTQQINTAVNSVIGTVCALTNLGSYYTINIIIKYLWICIMK